MLSGVNVTDRISYFQMSTVTKPGFPEVTTKDPYIKLTLCRVMTPCRDLRPPKKEITFLFLFQNVTHKTHFLIFPQKTNVTTRISLFFFTQNFPRTSRSRSSLKNRKRLVVGGSSSWTRWETISVLTPLIRVSKSLMTGWLIR